MTKGKKVYFYEKSYPYRSLWGFLEYSVFKLQKTLANFFLFQSFSILAVLSCSRSRELNSMY